MLFRKISYLQFLLKSTNQHGIHSPFVYQFVTQGIYIKNNSEALAYLKKKAAYNKFSFQKVTLFYKIITYFNPEYIGVDPPSFSVYADIFQQNHNTIAPFDPDSEQTYAMLLFSDDINLPRAAFTKLIQSRNVTDHIVIIVEDLYENQKKINLWKELLQQSLVSISIDFYYYGLLFLNRKQAKEHFVIRT